MACSNDSDSKRRQKTRVPRPTSLVPADYKNVLELLKSRISRERLRMVLAANAAMVLLYWDIGNVIMQRQKSEGWGTKVIDRLAGDLQRAFSDMKGLSPRNLKNMRAFAAAWPDKSIVQQVVAQIPWRSNLVLLNKLKTSNDRLWYAEQTLENGWSSAMLSIKIEQQLYGRQGKAINNFPCTLPPEQSDMAEQIFKDPYLFDFLGTADLRREREVEESLVAHVQQFLLELGTGFAFVGRQYHLEVADQDYYVDLLFYHLKLRCYVVVELKAVDFEPAFVGQMNLYLSAVDDLLRHRDDKPAVGLLLCKSKKRIIVEYALRDLHKPIGVAEWQTRLVRSLPRELKPSLPSIEQIEEELDSDNSQE